MKIQNFVNSFAYANIQRVSPKTMTFSVPFLMHTYVVPFLLHTFVSFYASLDMMDIENCHMLAIQTLLPLC